MIQGAGDDLKAAIDLALRFGVDDSVLWESILDKVRGDPLKVNQLL